MKKKINLKKFKLPIIEGLSNNQQRIMFGMESMNCNNYFGGLSLRKEIFCEGGF
jgi:hypothetical protein